MHRGQKTRTPAEQAAPSPSLLLVSRLRDRQRDGYMFFRWRRQRKQAHKKRKMGCR